MSPDHAMSPYALRLDEDLSPDEAMGPHEPMNPDEAMIPDPDNAIYRYGRLIADISNIYSDKWNFHRDSNIPNLTRDFKFCKFKFVYAYLKDLQDQDDLQLAVDSAIREHNPNNHACLLKLYLNMPKRIEHMKRRSVRIIAGKKYWVLLSYLNYRGILSLSQSYELFMSKLGKSTRRNMRKIRSKADRFGIIHKMEQSLLPSSSERLALAKHAYPAAFKPETVAVIDRVIEIQAQSFLSILRLQSGEMISCCAGFIENNVAFIIYQLNHREYLHHNPSLTNRAFLIENLIQAGKKKLSFVYGCEGMLNHACINESGANILVVRCSFLGLLCALTYIFQFPLSIILNRLSNVISKFGARIADPFRSPPKTSDASSRQ